MSTDDTRAMVEQVARQTAESVREQLSGVADKIDTDRQAASDALRAEMKDLVQRLGGAVDAKVENIDARISEMTREHEKQVAAVQSAARSSIDTMVEQMRAAGESVARDMERTATAEREAVAAQIEEARKVAGEAAKAQAQAESTQMSADRRIAEAEKAEAEAKRAVQIMNLRGEHEVNRATQEVEYKQRRKSTLAALDAEESEMANRFDAEAEQIEKGLERFYPEMRARLEELAQSADTEGEK